MKFENQGAELWDKSLPSHLRHPLKPQSLPGLTRDLSDIAEINTTINHNSDILADHDESAGEEDEEEAERIANARISNEDDYQLTTQTFSTTNRKRSRYENMNSANSFSKRRTLSNNFSSNYNSDILGSEDSTGFTDTPSEAFQADRAVCPPTSPPYLSSEPNELIDIEGPLLTSSPQAEVMDHPSEEIGEDGEEGNYQNRSQQMVNFNVDKFNRLGAYLSSDPILEDYTVNAFNTLISRAYDENNGKIDVENWSLRKIPDTIGDLKDLVISTKANVVKPAEIELYAAKNMLKTLPPELFDVDNCTVLSLRHNRIRKVPDNISNLKILKSFNISINEIQVLPYQITKLQNLENFILRPNPYLIELKDQDIQTYYQINKSSRIKDQRRFISQIKWTDPNLTRHLLSSMSRTSSSIQQQPTSQRDTYEHIMSKDKLTLSLISQVPKLSELALRNVGKYAPTYKETQDWKEEMEVGLQLKVTKAFQKRVFGEKCAVCEILTVDPVAKCLEWWDFKGQELIPIRLNFCSGRCVGKWMKVIEEDREAFGNSRHDIEDDGERNAFLQQQEDRFHNLNSRTSSSGNQDEEDDPMVFDAVF